MTFTVSEPGPGASSAAELLAGEWMTKLVRSTDDAQLLVWSLATALPGWDGVTPLRDLRDAEGEREMSPAAARILQSRLEATPPLLEHLGTTLEAELAVGRS